MLGAAVGVDNPGLPSPDENKMKPLFLLVFLLSGHGQPSWLGTPPSHKTLLCTGASLYAPYSLLLISNKFWMGGGGWGVVG
jgi:hypothetical protein